MSLKSLLKPWIGIVSALTLYGANAYANRVTNTNIYRSDSMTYDPVNSLVYTAVYDSTGLPVIGKATYIPGVTNPNALSFTYVTASVPVVDVNDDHMIISLGVGSDGKLLALWGCHSTTLNAWVGSGPGDITITTATMSGLNGPGGTPLVAGNTTAESTATYPIIRPSFSPAGDLLVLFRQGGSGAGSWLVYRRNSTTGAWTQVQNNLFGSVSNSAYLFTIDYDLQGRFYAGWQYRDSTNPIDAHDLYSAQSDDDFTTMQTVDGTSLTIPITSTNAGAALVLSIPKPTANYDAAQGCTHDARRTPILVYYITEETGPGTGVFVNRLYAVHRNPANNGWLQVMLIQWAATVTYVSRPYAQFYKGTLYVFYTEAISSVSVGLTCLYSRASDFTNVQRVQVDASNWGQSSPTCNKQLWNFGGRFQFLKLNTALLPGTPPNQPGILDVVLP